MAGVPITEKIDYSMLILLRSKQLKSNIKELKKKNIADKTQKLFDTHFTDAYDNLKDTNDLTLEESPSFNQAYSAEIILNAMQLANETAPPDEDLLSSDVPQDISTLGQSSRTPLIETSNTMNRRDDEILQKLESLTV